MVRFYMGKFETIVFCWKLIINKFFQLLIGVIFLIIITLMGIFFNKKKIEYLTEKIYGAIKYDEWF